ncbi:MAG: hypothetical protein QNJ70_25675 [Xenococcaceae cyanobacterium MO_207.B15]|nr:hypothetical protein [Xenococcaceae cyanobacterium MO_207.B15]
MVISLLQFGALLLQKFNPKTALQGNLPWWFDYSNKQKNAMRQVLTRCNL